MSPELLIGESADDATYKVDVYAFGILMWEVLHREKPYPPTWSLLKLFQQVDQGYRPKFSENVIEKSSVLVNLVKKCWDKDPDERPDFRVIVEQIAKILPVRCSRRQFSGRASSFRDARANSENSTMSTSASYDDLDAQLSVITADATLRGYALENMKRRLRERKLAMITSANEDIEAERQNKTSSGLEERPPSLRLSLRLVSNLNLGDLGSSGGSNLIFGEDNADLSDVFRSRSRSKISFDGSILESEGFRIGKKGIAQTPGVRLLRIRPSSEVNDGSGKRLKSRASFRANRLSIRSAGSFGSIKSSASRDSSSGDYCGRQDSGNHHYDEASLLQVGVLGAGQCGEVIKAVHISTMKLVAAKRVPIYAQDKISQVVRELRVLRGNLRGEDPCDQGNNKQRGDSSGEKEKGERSTFAHTLSNFLGLL